MMQIVQYPQRKDWFQLLQRPTQDLTTIKDTVRAIIDNVKQRGDRALKNYTKQFDGIELNDFTVTDEAWMAGETIDDDLKAAINVAINNVRTFHQAQKEPV